MNTIRIAGAIASKTGITLYLDSGGEVNLPNDSWRTKAILDKTVEPLARGETVEINLNEFSLEKQIEDKTAGVIRFIKKTMAQLQEMLAELQGDQPEEPARASAPQPTTAQNQEELVAVVKTADGDVHVPGVAKLERQMEYAARENAVGFQRFMERVASVIKGRGHTVQELLNFMERGDLPIADDGSIVAYKVLTTDKERKDRFVDCHSRKVSQALGSLVCMDEQLVDPSRRTQCSTGLHIARRGYLGSFSGDVMTLVKVAPEDVIAVPSKEPDKMRARAYHIVAVLPERVHHILRSNQPMTSDDGVARILADVIAGNHVGILEEVKITEARGGGVVTTPWTGPKSKTKVSASKKAKALDDGVVTITPKEIRETAKAAIQEKKQTTGETPKETKAERDARKKREKRAAERAAREAAAAPKTEPTPVVEPAVPIEASSLDIDRVIPGETKAERDARRKREKRALLKAQQGQA